MEISLCKNGHNFFKPTFTHWIVCTIQQLKQGKGKCWHGRGLGKENSRMDLCVHVWSDREKYEIPSSSENGMISLMTNTKSQHKIKKIKM